MSKRCLRNDSKSLAGILLIRVRLHWSSWFSVSFVQRGVFVHISYDDEDNDRNRHFDLRISTKIWILPQIITSFFSIM